MYSELFSSYFAKIGRAKALVCLHLVDLQTVIKSMGL